MGAEVRAEWETSVAGRTITSGRGDPSGLTRAHRLYRLAFGLFLVAVVVGLAWDRAWHATRAFDTFYSPPHLFVYSMAVLTARLVAALACSPGLRAWFGPPRRVFPLPVAMPGALTLLGGGFATLGLYIPRRSQNLTITIGRRTIEWAAFPLMPGGWVVREITKQPWTR